MAEYLSPGVYVEEFDSGVKAMEGVGTSTAGFIGMAQKGPLRGTPVLITSMADYRRRFGGGLSERVYGEMRFLPNAVEQFFNNGGSACYVMRVCREAESGDAPNPAEGGDVPKPSGEGDASNPSENGDAPKPSEEGSSPEAAESGSETPKSGDGAVPASACLTAGEGKNASAFLTLTAANPGAWGNELSAGFTPVLKSRTAVTVSKTADGAVSCKGKDFSAFAQGDLVCIQYSEKNKDISCNIVDKKESGGLTLRWNADVKEGGAQANLYLLEWSMAVQDETAAEQYENVSFNPESNAFIGHVLKKSQLITVRADMEKLTSGALEKLTGTQASAFRICFQGGSDGKVEFDASLYIGQDGAPDQRTGLAAFQTLSDVSIMAIPGITDSAVQSALVTHCERLGNRFAILDMPFEDREVAKLLEFREGIDSSYAAMYHPWLACYDASAKRNVFLPPSGALAGIYGRTDNTRGVHKAPANETVRSCTGLSVSYNEAEQAKLNPKGVNLIRAIPGQGIRVWGARTCSGDGNWKYVNVRRLFIFIEESIRANTNWAVFEPNDEMLWSRVEGTIRVFLTAQWRNGALAGATADEAFFINIGKSTMTDDDILNGRLICVIGVAPVRPAEFVVFRITQKMESAQ